jgi:AMP phosphorylase
VFRAGALDLSVIQKSFFVAKRYARDFMDLGERLGIKIECAITYGGQPIGRTIGCALEAKEAMMALEGKEAAGSLIEKACGLAGILLEMGGVVHTGGKEYAHKILTDGRALAKMKEIIEAQGGDPKVTSEDIPIGKYKYDIITPASGYIADIHNKNLVKIARAAGAPKDQGAGIILKKKGGDKVEKGEILYTICADNERKLQTARTTAHELRPIKIEGMILQKIPSFHGMGR